MSQTTAVAHKNYVFDRAPVMLYWEITRACDLACAHCRADAMPHRDPRELDAQEAMGLLSQIAEFGPPLPHLVITGGDPLKRPDLTDVVKRAAALKIPVSMAPSATPLLTRRALAKLRRAGIAGLSLSLDGSTAQSHDAFRGIAGCFQRTLAAAHDAASVGMAVQINTLISGDTLADLPALFALVSTLPIQRWSLFFLIGVGRGRVLQGLTAQEAEEVCHWLYTRSLEAPFTIAATEAPFFRRVAIERGQRAGLSPRCVPSVSRAFGIRDGNGIAFVSHRGEVQPSGFLPVVAGNVRETSLVDLYRRAPLFTALRDVDQFRGRCGECPFNALCGGSRARAYAQSGSYLEADPLCAYEPARGPMAAG